MKERFLELHEKAQKWEILAYHLKVICAENPEVEPLPDLENNAYLKREEAYLTIATMNKLFKHLEFVSQQYPDYNSFQELMTIMFQGLVERKIAPAMVYHWLTHQMFWSLCQYEESREFDVLHDVILLYRDITFLKYLCGRNRSSSCFFNKMFLNKQRVVFAIVLSLLLWNLYVFPWNL